jgi:metal transporter CNNM
MFSGMTIGMFSMSITALERKIKLGDKRAAKIYPVRKNGSLLLCTMLFGNVGVNTAIAIILNSIATGFTAGLISTALIVIFGEVLPQAAFARHALNFGSKVVWIVKIFIFMLYPVAAPIALALDKILGKEGQIFWSKQEISEIIKHHEDSPHSTIDSDEERIILGALSFSDKTAYDVMTPKTVVYYLNAKKQITDSLIEEIKTRGLSRIPVYENSPDNMIGILYIKDLIGLKFDENSTIGDIIRKDKVLFVDWADNLDKILNQMVKSRKHLAFVSDEFGVFNGIVTLEDIVEEILKIEIVDEADKIEDLQRHARERVKRRFA